jgi:hypothetical protein
MTTTTLQRCQGCGRETARLEDGDHCPVCHLQDLTCEVQGISSNLEAVGNLVREVVIYGYAHPDDVRELVENAMRERQVTEWTPKRRRWSEALAAKDAYAGSLRVEVVE